MHPKVKEFQQLLKSAKRRPKSTYNLFVKWVDIAKAFNVHRVTVGNWSHFLPPLPITRQYMERWLAARKVLTHNTDYDRIRQLFEWRCYRKATARHTSKMMGINEQILRGMWKAGLKNYSEIRSRSNRLPDTPEEAEAIWEKVKKDRRTRISRRVMRKVNESRKVH